jgi:hypothetical protein
MFALIFLKIFTKNKNYFLFPLAIFQRILRFLPMYIMTVLIYLKILPYIGYGPLYSQLPNKKIIC